jgi:hypothetical protein
MHMVRRTVVMTMSVPFESEVASLGCPVRGNKTRVLFTSGRVEAIWSCEHRKKNRVRRQVRQTPREVERTRSWANAKSAGSSEQRSSEIALYLSLTVCVQSENAPHDTPRHDTHGTHPHDTARGYCVTRCVCCGSDSLLQTRCRANA